MHACTRRYAHATLLQPGGIGELAYARTPTGKHRLPSLAVGRVSAIYGDRDWMDWRHMAKVCDACASKSEEAPRGGRREAALLLPLSHTRLRWIARSRPPHDTRVCVCVRVTTNAWRDDEQVRRTVEEKGSGPSIEILHVADANHNVQVDSPLSELRNLLHACMRLCATYDPLPACMRLCVTYMISFPHASMHARRWTTRSASSTR